MGCCISTSDYMQHQNGLKHHKTHLRSSTPKPNETHEIQSSVPPPQPVEEESVKEVLSETPISKPHQVPILMAEMNTQMPSAQHRRKGPTLIINKTCSTSESFSEKVSQISETCSMNESFSTTNATVTQKKEDEAMSKRITREGTQNRKRSYTVDGNRIGGREQRRPKSPARMPEKKSPVGSRLVTRREPGQVRRDPSEGSRQRSGSPSSVRMLNSSGVLRGQLKPPPGGAGRWLPPAKCVEKENVGKENGVVPQEESLDNPHVSMECFIFI